MKKYALIALSILFVIPVFSQTTEEIVERHLLAIGGAAWDSVRALDQQFTMSFSNAKIEIECRESIVADQYYRMEQSAISFFPNSIRCIGAKKSWGAVMLSKGAQVDKIDSTSAYQQRYLFQIPTPLYRWKERGYRIEYLGMDTLKNRPAHKIMYRADAISPKVIHWIDAENYLELKRYYSVVKDGKTESYTYVYEDYRPQGPVILPYRVLLRNKNGTMKYEYKTILLNPVFEPGWFEAPE